jgi:hypothetical protein
MEVHVLNSPFNGVNCGDRQQTHEVSEHHNNHLSTHWLQSISKSGNKPFTLPLRYSQCSQPATKFLILTLPSETIGIKKASVAKDPSPTATHP